MLVEEVADSLSKEEFIVILLFLMFDYPSVYYHDKFNSINNISLLYFGFWILAMTPWM